MFEMLCSFWSQFSAEKAAGRIQPCLFLYKYQVVWRNFSFWYFLLLVFFLYLLYFIPIWIFWVFIPQTIWPFKVDFFQADERPDRRVQVLSAAWLYSKVEDKPRHAPVLNLNLPSRSASKTSGPAEKHLRCGRSRDFGTRGDVVRSFFFFFWLEGQLEGNPLKVV